MSRRLFDLAVATRRRSGSFSLRLAIIVDLVYVGAGAVGGVAVGQYLLPPAQSVESHSPSCLAPGRQKGGSPPVIIDDLYHRWIRDKTPA